MNFVGLRQGDNAPALSGPLGLGLINKLANDPDPNYGYPLILDSWYDADGNPQGNAADFLNELY